MGEMMRSHDLLDPGQGKKEREQRCPLWFFLGNYYWMAGKRVLGMGMGDLARWVPGKASTRRTGESEIQFPRVRGVV